MNINKINANKSNLRIAPNTNLSHQHSALVTIDLSGPITSPTNNNNKRNERNNNNNNNNNLPFRSRSRSELRGLTPRSRIRK